LLESQLRPDRIDLPSCLLSLPPSLYFLPLHSLKRVPLLPFDSPTPTDPSHPTHSPANALLALPHPHLLPPLSPLQTPQTRSRCPVRLAVENPPARTTGRSTLSTLRVSFEPSLLLLLLERADLPFSRHSAAKAGLTVRSSFASGSRSADRIPPASVPRRPR
jgi:hypothetical protein